MQALRRFLGNHTAAVPQGSYAQMLTSSRLLLARLGGRRTLARIAAADRAIATGEVERQAWWPAATRNGVSLEMSADHLAPVFDPRFPADRAVKAYARLTLSSPVVTDLTRCGVPV